MRRPRRTFASPFVITIACGGKPAEVVPLPVADVPSHVAPDARSSEPPIDAVPPVDAGPDPALPDGPELVIARDGSCYHVSHRGAHEGNVRCPPGGANVRLSPVVSIVVRGSSTELDVESLTCTHDFGNPPGIQRVPCPPQLLPRLIGISPDEHCMYQGVQFACGADEAIIGLKLRIIHMSITGTGVQITIGKHARDGLGPGQPFHIGKYKGVLATCNERTCTAIITGLTFDQLKVVDTVDF